MAIGAMRALRDMRSIVPGDVSVVGFDDIDLAQHVDPPLTTVHQPIRRKGEEAVRLLLAVIQSREPAKAEHRLLETRLIVRGSTGPAPRRRLSPAAHDVDTARGAARAELNDGRERTPSAPDRPRRRTTAHERGRPRFAIIDRAIASAYSRRRSWSAGVAAVHPATGVAGIE